MILNNSNERNNLIGPRLLADLEELLNVVKRYLSGYSGRLCCRSITVQVAYFILEASLGEPFSRSHTDVCGAHKKYERVQQKQINASVRAFGRLVKGLPKRQHHNSTVTPAAGVDVSRILSKYGIAPLLKTYVKLCYIIDRLPLTVAIIVES